MFVGIQKAGQTWKRKMELGRVWRTLRGPFPLPRRTLGHKCKWEGIDIDIAGCRVCGRVHFCSVHTDDINMVPMTKDTNIDAECEKEVCDSHVVCHITGYCVQESIYSDNEFIDTAAVDMPSSPHEAVSYEDILVHVRRILCSKGSEECLRNENERVSNKLSSVFHRILRDFKLQNPRTLPNICNLAALLAHRTGNIRLCPRRFDVNKREYAAKLCCGALTRLVRIMSKMCPALIPYTKHESFFIGLLYLMRSGLVLHNTCVLPRVPMLQKLLPLESYLNTHFGIKCKSITEIENLIKMHARTLTIQQVHSLGMAAIDTRY